MSLIGLDLGTTACNSIAVSCQGKIIAYGNIEYSLIKIKEDYIELDPVNVWECVKIVLRQIASQIGKDPVEALSISAMGDAITPFNEKN
jgi:xylulokinase